MTQMDLLVSGVLVFVMALIGLVLTVVEFRKAKSTPVKLESRAAERARSVSRSTA